MKKVKSETVTEKPITEELFIISSGASSGPMPRNLRIEEVSGKNNSWLLTLLDETAQEIASAELNGNAAKDYLRTKGGITVKAFDNKIGAGTWPLKNEFTLKGALYSSYATMNKQRKDDREMAGKSTARVQQGVDDGPAPSQAAIMTQLFALEQKTKRLVGGHVAVKMSRITLDYTRTLPAGGQRRDITHLYLQSIDGREIRCYLGNAEGAYQRVHTSLTTGQPMTAHTMVQTGAEVAVPGWRGNGTRVGFDSVETTAGKGVRDRALTARPANKSTANELLKGQDFSALDPDSKNGAYRMAENFNEVLDEVFKDIIVGSAAEREVTGITEDFRLLDDIWTFPEKVPATPAEEWRRSLGS